MLTAPINLLQNVFSSNVDDIFVSCCSTLLNLTCHEVLCSCISALIVHLFIPEVRERTVLVSASSRLDLPELRSTVFGYHVSVVRIITGKCVVSLSVGDQELKYNTVPMVLNWMKSSSTSMPNSLVLKVPYFTKRTHARN